MCSAGPNALYLNLTTGSLAGPLLRDRSEATDDSDSAPLTPSATGPSDEDRSLKSRFQKQFQRNADSLLSAATGEKLPQLPVQLRKYDTLADARQT